MPRKNHQQWLAGQVKTICELGNQVSRIQPDVSHDYRSHTVLKLAALNHCLEVFLPIARTRIREGTFDSAIFIDLFAGCGATREPGTGDWLAGSPVLAAGNRKGSFDRIICIEKNKAHCHALQERLNCFPGRMFHVVHGDCNQEADSIRKYIPYGNPLVFVFVDPEGMDLQWRTLEALSNNFPYMDLLLNIPHGAERVLAVARGGGQPSRRTMEMFAGPDWLQLLLSEDQKVVDHVDEKISSVLGRRVGDRVLVKDAENRPMYSLLIRVRETRGGSSFFRGYESMLEHVRQLKPSEVAGVLNDYFRRSITSFESGMKENATDSGEREP